MNEFAMAPRMRFADNGDLLDFVVGKGVEFRRCLSVGEYGNVEIVIKQFVMQFPGISERQ